MELAQLFGVSRITSKKALQTLNRDGVVERLGKIDRRGAASVIVGPTTDRQPAAQQAYVRSRRATPIFASAMP